MSLAIIESAAKYGAVVGFGIGFIGAKIGSEDRKEAVRWVLQSPTVTGLAFAAIAATKVAIIKSIDRFGFFGALGGGTAIVIPSYIVIAALTTKAHLPFRERTVAVAGSLTIGPVMGWIGVTTGQVIGGVLEMGFHSVKNGLVAAFTESSEKIPDL